MENRHKTLLIEKFGLQRAELIIKKIIITEQANKVRNEELAIKHDKERTELINKSIPKADLTDGEVYIGFCERLTHNKFAKWNATKEVFLVEKYIFGMLIKDFEIDHIADTKENNLAGFAPFEIKK